MDFRASFKYLQLTYKSFQLRGQDDLATAISIDISYWLLGVGIAYWIFIEMSINFSFNNDIS